jgi:hypothetical protein
MAFPNEGKKQYDLCFLKIEKVVKDKQQKRNVHLILNPPLLEATYR